MNLLRVGDVSRVGAGSCIKQDANAGTRGDNEVGTGEDNIVSKKGQDNKVGIEGDNKAGTRGRNNNEVGDLGQDNKTGTKRRDDDGVGNPRQDDKAGIRKRENKTGPDNKGATELAARACCTGL